MSSTPWYCLRHSSDFECVAYISSHYNLLRPSSLCVLCDFFALLYSHNVYVLHLWCSFHSHYTTPMSTYSSTPCPTTTFPSLITEQKKNEHEHSTTNTTITQQHTNPNIVTATQAQAPPKLMVTPPSPRSLLFPTDNATTTLSRSNAVRRPGTSESTTTGYSDNSVPS